jgi:hypothetical protein
MHKGKFAQLNGQRTGIVALLFLAACAGSSRADIIPGGPFDYINQGNVYVANGAMHQAQNDTTQLSFTLQEDGGETESTLYTQFNTDSINLSVEAAAYGDDQNASGEGASAAAYAYVGFSVDTPEEYTISWSIFSQEFGGIIGSNSVVIFGEGSSPEFSYVGTDSSSTNVLLTPGNNYYLQANVYETVFGAEWPGQPGPGAGNRSISISMAPAGISVPAPLPASSLAGAILLGMYAMWRNRRHLKWS